MDPISMVLTIIVINVVYVSLFTVRLMFVMKGRTLLASFISVVEVFIYLFNRTEYCSG